MLLRSLFGPRQALATRSEIGPLSQVPGVLYAGQSSAAGVRVDETECLSLSAVFAACNLLSAVLGTLPLSVYRKEGRIKSVADTQPAHRVLHTQLNPWMTAAVGRRTLEFHRLLWGNCYGEIGWDGGGNVRAIWPIEPWRTQPKHDGENGELYYLVDGKRRVSALDMIHVPLISFDGVKGRSFVDFAIESLGLGLATQEFAARYFGNGAKPGGVLSHPGTPAKNTRDEMKTGWQQEHGGPRRSNKVAVVWGGWKYEADDGAFNAQESQLIEQRRFTVEEVARWFNMPPHMLRELARSTNNNIEAQGIDLVLYTFGPPLVMYEQEYDRKLLNPPALYSKHNVNALMRGDSEARTKFYRELWNIGVLSENDIRDYEDMNPVEGGDTYFVPVNMVPLQRALQAPVQPAPGPASGDGRPNPDARPAPPKPKPQPPAGEDPDEDRQSAAMRMLLALTLQRLGRVEATEVRRAAEKPRRFLAWMDEFYPRHLDKLREAVEPVQLAARQLGLAVDDPAAVAQAWCDASRTALLQLAGDVQAAELPAAVERLLTQWDADRAAAMLPSGEADA